MSVEVRSRERECNLNLSNDEPCKFLYRIHDRC